MNPLPLIPGKQGWGEGAESLMLAYQRTGDESRIHNRVLNPVPVDPEVTSLGNKLTS